MGTKNYNIQADNFKYSRTEILKVQFSIFLKHNYKNGSQLRQKWI